MSRRARWATALEASWWRHDARPAWPLRLLARLYGSVIALRRQLYQNGALRQVQLPVPVIVVGNRIVGGAGKTPVTLALLEALAQAGWRPAVVSRGHGRQGHAPRAVTAPASAAEAGDEPLLMARRAGVPVWVGRDRAATAQALLAAHADVDVVVCDDGLQHLRLARDLALVVFDARGEGNGHLLPAGPLREPLDVTSGERRRWVVYNAGAPSTPLPGAMTVRRLAGLVPLAAWWAGDASALRDFSVLRNQPVVAVAGIGAPQRFFDDLAAEGLRCTPLPLPDHHHFDALPWPADAQQVVVTEKDAVKLPLQRVARDRPTSTVWVVPMALTLPPALLAEVLAALPSRGAPR